MSAILEFCPRRSHIVHVEGALRTPVSRVLRHNVNTLLLRGEHRIILDLSAVSRIDAGGVGELLRSFNMATAANGALQIVNATGRVRELLDRAQVFGLLSGERGVEQQLA